VKISEAVGDGEPSPTELFISENPIPKTQCIEIG
jgi:hypothetical protein